MTSTIKSTAKTLLALSVLSTNELASAVEHKDIAEGEVPDYVQHEMHPKAETAPKTKPTAIPE